MQNNGNKVFRDAGSFYILDFLDFRECVSYTFVYYKDGNE